MSRILVVDDDQVVRDVVSDALIDAGYAVAQARDGFDALDQLREHPPDAILLDLMMPVMDGWMFLEALQDDSEWGAIPIGIMSAAPTARRTAQTWGVQVIGKPFVLDELLDGVEHMLTESVNGNTSANGRSQE